MKNIDISYLIATNRNYEESPKRVIDCLESAGALDNGEILVISPDEINDKRIRFIKDNMCINGPQAFNYGATKSKGDTLVVLTDDNLVTPEIIRAPEILASDLFINRKYKIFTAAIDGRCYLEPIPLNHPYGPKPETKSLPRILMCRFPILNKKTLELLGGKIFHPNFNIRSPHFADNYLSYYLWFKGEETIEVTKIRYSLFNSFWKPTEEDKKGFDACLKIFLDLRRELFTSKDPKYC